MAATLLQLRVAVLDNLNDLQNEVLATGERFKTNAINRAINRSMRHYTNHLNSFYQGYLNANISLNILANVREYALASTFRSPIYEVRRTIQDTDYYLNPTLQYNMIIPTTPIPNTEWLPSFHLEGQSIIFSSYPMQDEVGAILIKHQKKLIDLAMDSSILDDQLYDAEDCIILRATIFALKSKDVSGAFKNIGGFESELATSERVFFTQVGNRYVKPDHPIPSDELMDYFM